MCGLVGWIGENFKDSTLNKIQLSLSHRGPDDFGKWVDYSKKIFLLHRRLSIIDVSKNGSQPMVSSSKRYVLTYNGEIYNHLDIRKSIKNYKWKSSSDTETLLVGLELWGLKKTLQKIKGMFAFSVFDKELDKLFLIRDRVGEKPLYYGWQGKSFIFSSELKAITKHPSFLKNIDHKTLYHFVKHSNIPAPYSIYKGIKKLNPGSILTFCLKTKNTQVEKYWNVYDFVPEKKDLFKGTIEDAQNQLEILIQNSVKQQMISDVPLGAFLSGGIDSSTIVTILQSMSSKPVRTFSIGFENENFNEAPFAKQIATYLKTEHNELYVNPKDVLKVIPDIGNIYCEPFADSSQIPTLLLSRFAKKYVTVCLSGDGGDEMFLGYNRYLYSEFYFNKLKILPLRLRILISFFLLSFNYDNYNKIYSILNNLKITKTRYEVGELIHKFAKVLKINSYENLYKNFVGTIDDKDLLRNSIVSKNFANENIKISSTDDMNIEDFKTYLPDDILCKVDRASMSTSLETRMPFLNKDLYEFLSNIPVSKKLLSNKLKSISKSLVYDFVPSKYFNTQKKGFSIPLDKLLRNELKSFCLDTIHTGNSNLNEFLNMKNLHNIFQIHQDNKKNFGKEIWNSVMFIKWFNAQ